MCQMESKLTNGLVFIFLSFSVLPDDTHDEKLLHKVDATETEPYLAMCHILLVLTQIYLTRSLTVLSVLKHAKQLLAFFTL